jgi:replicative DNA helicase
VAGRPSHGKTSLGTQIIDHIVFKLFKKALIFSLEMPKEQMATRMAYSKARLNEAKLHSGKVDAADYDRLNDTVTMMSEYRENLIIDDSSTSPDRIINSMLRHHRKHSLDVVMLDYVQDVSFPDGSSHQDLANFVKRITKFCKENMITLILISQLRRDVDNRGDKRPNMGDLSETKKLEEVASHVVSVYRDDVYTLDESEKPGITEIRVMKNRYGGQGAADFIWEGEYTHFKDIKA